MKRREYTTILGDTWDIVAHRIYGDRKRGDLFMHLLLEANQAHRDTVIFSSGVRLVVPEIPAGIPDSLPPWKR